MKTREQVVEALDRHLNELDSLRRALGNTEKPLLAVVPSSAPAPMASFPPAAPMDPKHYEMPSPHPAPMMPMMTQILWPAKNDVPSSGPLRAPAPAGSPPSSPMVAYSGMSNAAAARDMAVDPDLEKATLEELNAALAFAFNSVSKAREQPASPSGQSAQPW